MFQTLTTHTNTSTGRKHSSIVAALVGLTIAASACGGAAPADSVDAELVAVGVDAIDRSTGTLDLDPVADRSKATDDAAPYTPISDTPIGTPDTNSRDTDPQDTNPQDTNAAEPGAPTPDMPDTTSPDTDTGTDTDEPAPSTDQPPSTDTPDDGSDGGAEDEPSTPPERPDPVDAVDETGTAQLPDAPPAGPATDTPPTRPELSDAVDAPTENKLPDPPQADMEVAVRNVKIEATPECFANGLTSRYFHTTHSPVAVVLDTNGISDTALTTMAHDDTELTDQLRELSISDGALREHANSTLGYAVTVQVQGAVSGGIVVDWAQTATAPGTYTSPVFNGPTDDCDITVDFLVIELH